MKKISTIPFYHIRPGQIGTTFYFFLKINRSTSSKVLLTRKALEYYSMILFYHTIPGQIRTTLFFIQISVKFFTKAFCSIFSSNSPLNLQPAYVTLKSVNHNLFYQRLLHALNIAVYPIQFVKAFLQI